MTDDEVAEFFDWVVGVLALEKDSPGDQHRPPKERPGVDDMRRAVGVWQFMFFLLSHAQHHNSDGLWHRAKHAAGFSHDKS